MYLRHLGDITKIDGSKIEKVDAVTFGAPCQDISVANRNRAGMKHEKRGDDETTRSGLFFDAVRVIKEMRESDRADGRTDEFIRPRYAVYENVPGALSSNGGQDFAAVLTELIKIAEPQAPDVPVPKNGWPKSGCLYDEMGRWSIAFRVHDAQFWGAAVYSDDGILLQQGTPQRRRRIAVVADFGGTSAPEILFVRKGKTGNIETSDE